MEPAVNVQGRFADAERRGIKWEIKKQSIA